MDDKTVVTASDQTITCAMTGLTQTASISWTDPDGATISDGYDYTVIEGDATAGAQDSTLTIRTAKLQALGTTSIFTCDVTSGQYPDSETASNTMSLTKYTIGRFSKTK